MFDKLFGNRKTRIRNLILIITPFILLIGFFGYFAYRSLSTMISGGEEEKETSYNIEEMTYKLRSNATEYQVSLFNELAEAVEDGTDSLKIAELVAENYVADFYTWTNKSGSYDVGGIYYVYSPQRQLIALDARMHFYKYLTYYINTYGSDALIEVTNINVTDSHKNESPYEINGDSFESYYVVLEWEYNDFTFDDGNGYMGMKENGYPMTYMHKGYFTVIVNDDGRYEIVEAWGDE